MAMGVGKNVEFLLRRQEKSRNTSLMPANVY
jgi:hypothetical protein